MIKEALHVISHNSRKFLHKLCAYIFFYDSNPGLLPLCIAPIPCVHVWLEERDAILFTLDLQTLYRASVFGT